MQPVPTLRRQRIAAQFVVAGHAPHIGGDVILLGQNFLRPQRLIQNRTAAEQLHHGLAFSSRAVFVDATQNAFFAPSGISGIG